MSLTCALSRSASPEYSRSCSSSSPYSFILMPQAGRRDHDGVDARLEENADVAAGELPGGFQIAGVGVYRTAADLLLWDHDLAPVSRQHPGHGVHLGAMYQRHHAAGEQCDSPTPLAGRRHHLPGGLEARPRHLGRRGLQGRHPGGDQAQYPRPPHQPLQAGALVQP